MKKISRIIASSFLFISVIFLVKYLITSWDAITVVEKPGQHLLWSIACLFFFYVTFSYIFKYIKDKGHEALTNIETITVILQFISLILLLLGTISGLGLLILVSFYLGYILILLGGVEYYRTKHYLCISFVSWGVFLLLCASTLIYGVHAYI